MYDFKTDKICIILILKNKAVVKSNREFQIAFTKRLYRRITI